MHCTREKSFLFKMNIQRTTLFFILCLSPLFHMNGNLIDKKTNAEVENKNCYQTNKQLRSKIYINCAKSDNRIKALVSQNCCFVYKETN